jgi:hypothetical protein
VCRLIYYQSLEFICVRLIRSCSWCPGWLTLTSWTRVWRIVPNNIDTNNFPAVWAIHFNNRIARYKCLYRNESVTAIQLGTWLTTRLQNTFRLIFIQRFCEGKVERDRGQCTDNSWLSHCHNSEHVKILTWTWTGWLPRFLLQAKENVMYHSCELAK